MHSQSFKFMHDYHCASAMSHLNLFCHHSRHHHRHLLLCPLLPLRVRLARLCLGHLWRLVLLVQQQEQELQEAPALVVVVVLAAPSALFSWAALNHEASATRDPVTFWVAANSFFSISEA